MPQLDFAVLCDYVRTERGIAHMVAAGINTIYSPEVPTGRNVGLAIRLLFTRAETAHPHRIEVLFQDTDGRPLVRIDGGVEVVWDESLPPGWLASAVMGLNFGLPLQEYGLYSIEILSDGVHLKTLQIRMVPAQEMI